MRPAPPNRQTLWPENCRQFHDDNYYYYCCCCCYTWIDLPASYQRLPSIALIVALANVVISPRRPAPAAEHTALASFFFRAVPCCVFRSWLLGVLVTEDFHCTSSIYYNLLHTVSQPASRSSRVETERERSIWSEPAEINFTPLILSVFCLVLIVLFEGHHQFLREVRFLSLHPKASVGLAVAKARRYLL